MKKNAPARMMDNVTTTSSENVSAGRARWALAVALSAFAGGLWALTMLTAGNTAAQEEPPQSETTSLEIMWTKLDLSHNVLDALAVNDFEALEAYAEDLDALGSAGFLYILDTEQYRSHADGFRAAARALGRAAKDRNAEAGTLAYMDLTLRCIRCHQSFDVVPR